jgi:tetratricopeptide (TPR) repeat protein
VFVGVSDSQTKKGIDAVSAIEYQYVKKSDDIADSEVAERQAAALASLASYTEKKGIVGIRANMLAADINFAKKDFAASLDAWLKAAALGEKLYTAPICYFNAGVCAEELEKTAEAIKYYETAANKPDFYLAAHAFFNLGRMNEVAADFEKAKTAYQAVIDKYPGNDFANLAQSRIIALNVSGKAE